MVVGVNPVIQEVEAIAAPTVTTITLRSAWTGTGGTYSFLANQTSEGLRDAVQAIRSNNASLQSFIDSIDTAATADSVAQRTSDGSINAVNVYASGKLGVGADATGLATAGAQFIVSKSGAQAFEFSPNGSASGKNRLLSFDRVAAAEYPLQVRASTIEFLTSSTERLRIDSSGRVGIGTTSPSAVLETFGGTSFIGAKFKGYAAGKTAIIGGDANNVWFGDDDGSIGTTNRVTIRGADNRIEFTTNSAERMRIDSSGNLIVGATTPLGEDSFTAYQDGTTVVRRTDTAGLLVRRDGGNGACVEFFKSSTSVGSISVTASTTAYNTSSDYRLKEDWQPMEGSIDRLMQLKPCNFAWKIDGSRVDGFLAHEAQEVVPEAVTGEKNGDKMQAIDHSKLVPLLTAALQDALKKIDDLEVRLNALESK
jgi:hypothetical protein